MEHPFHQRQWQSTHWDGCGIFIEQGSGDNTILSVDAGRGCSGRIHYLLDVLIR